MTRYLVALALSCAIGLAAGPAEAAYRGGSNFNWYRLDTCDREPYGVLKNYHTARPQIDQVLTDMRAQGQERLRIGLFHVRGGQGGTVIDSGGGNMDPQYHKNLRDLLATAQSKGFGEIIFSFFPQGQNNPGFFANQSQWSQGNEEMFQENWNLIYNVVLTLNDSGVHYKVDLGNEMSPRTGGTFVINEYARKMWGNYTYVFGNTKTVGFSMVSDVAAATNLGNVYGNNPPAVFDVHLYDNAYTIFRQMDQAMDNLGYSQQGWIIGETFYNDSQAASDIKRAETDSARGVYFVLQWPLTRAITCPDVDTIPVGFNNFLSEGF